ncbi:CTP synthase (UTP-ammonia ligase) [Mycoplasma suis KI3806]|uniref:CTP synthase (glutamine hydrolyzing) n=1 Tax=Mycoplasma suis (strain KI_3806) TaxID=708248 RepID=F0V3I0_MYCS3|nr:CTP synthase [Mycoplasma suis]CBZ40402.1 CTP synthase (UTP-ammonia ligase) [Mycoplasma suis KI3806]
MKIIFLTGGVYSSLGKGVTLSSIGKVLQFEGFKCSVLKFDPYLNYNSKFLSPNQHGEVFVTKDGEETDLDLGHYERFLGIELSAHSCCTSGKIFHSLMKKEMNGEYNGETVQIVPHLIQEIVSRFEYFENIDTEILLVELGGTVSDLEQKPFLLAAEYLKNKKKDDMIFIHLAPVLSLNYNGDKKTKPIQHSLSILKKVGITPDILILKGDSCLTEAEISKISFNFPQIPRENIFSSCYKLDIFEIPIHLYEKEKLCDKLLSLLKLEKKNNSSERELNDWKKFNSLIKGKKKHVINVAIVGKYSSCPESYYSIIQSLKFAGYGLSAELNISVLKSENLHSESQLEGFHLICIPPGFGEKSLNGIFLAIKYARENKIPFLGICFGMQLSVIEFFRNQLGISDANSLEIDPETSFPILVPWSDSKDMRVGEIEVNFSENTKLHNIYGSIKRDARHRNRYVFNAKLASQLPEFKNSSLKISAWSGDIVEGVELEDHPFFVGVQYHPEFNSRPLSPEPLFIEAISSAIKQIN